MNQTYLNKTRDEQEEEFKTYFQPYADPDCKLCYGTGKKHWHTELRQYVICECVFINIESEKQKLESLIVRPS